MRVALFHINCIARPRRAPLLLHPFCLLAAQLCACLCDLDPAWLHRTTGPVCYRCSSYSLTTHYNSRSTCYLISLLLPLLLRYLDLTLDNWSLPKIISRMTTRDREQTLAFRYLPFASAFCVDFSCFWRWVVLHCFSMFSIFRFSPGSLLDFPGS